MTALDVFAVAVGLTIDARAREPKDHLPHRTLALDGAPFLPFEPLLVLH